MMKIGVFNIVLSVVLLFNCLGISNSEDYEVTDCDRDIAKIMCDNYINDVASCAELMPQDEQIYFFECSADLEISTSENWSGMLSDVCSQTDSAQVVSDIILCWNDKMNATIDEMKDDKVYPYEHFTCKARLYTETIEKTSCLCQLEKGSLCIKTPSGPWDENIPNFG